MLKKINLFFLSLLSIIKINLIIIFGKFLKKKIFFFYHPRKLVTGTHTYYVEDLFNEYYNNSVVIFGHESRKIHYGFKTESLKLNSRYIYIQEKFLKYIFGCDIFMSALICDFLTKNSYKIYLNHHVYDSPMVNHKKEKKLCERLSKYNLVLLASSNLVSLYEEIFKRNKNEKLNIPYLTEIGYPRLDYLLKKYPNNNKDSILISPTNIDADPDFSLFEILDRLIEELLNHTNFKIIFRPHPLNRADKRIWNIREKYSKNYSFNYDISENYIDVFSKSFCAVTDHSDTAYMFAFLNLCPVAFYSNKNLNDFIESKKEEKTKYKYANLNYFKNRDKIGSIFNEKSNFKLFFNKLYDEYKNYEKPIFEIRKQIKYINISKIMFHKVIEKVFNEKK